MVPKQQERGPWNLGPGACGGPNPKKPALRDTGMRDPGRNKGEATRLASQLPRLVTHI